MRKIILKDNVKMYAVKKIKKEGYAEKRYLDVFFKQPGKDREYAFSCDYSEEAYDLCKSEVRVNHVSCKRTKNRNLMKFIDYLNLMLPYLVHEINLPVAA